MMKEVNLAQATTLTSPNPLVLVCTEKENGKPNMAPVSFFMFTSFQPPMVSFAMMQGSNSGANFRRTKKAVIAVPGTSIREAAMKYGTASGNKEDKLDVTPIALTSMEDSDIQFPEDSRVAFAVTLEQTIETGTHYHYICKIDKIVADEEREGLFAWNGYGVAAPALQKN